MKPIRTSGSLRMAVLALLLGAMMLAACNPTPVPTLQPTAVATSVPTAAPTTVPTLEPTTAPVSETVKIVLIAINDNGQAGPLVGCGDSAVTVDREVTGSGDPLRDAITALLAIKTRDYGESGLVTILSTADLQITNINLTDGKAQVDLTGTLNLGGVCDSPRVEAQLNGTALAVPGVTDVLMTLNGQPLHDALSEK